ncbi:polycomb protein suz12-A [Anopheles cruzii]|uniref:polycomb protein suz12-A n=1 Tax=Anopheles cruzii TaxID=68878 RepID=UPI0022EC3E11|nr:polycomb protein suz12-A [Anopheles cruzii]
MDKQIANSSSSKQENSWQGVNGEGNAGTNRRKMSSNKKNEKEATGTTTTALDVAVPKQEKMDFLNVDLEIFMQALEKPSQIYRFLRTRNMLMPIFLSRNLSYMRNRCLRSHKSRQTFKIDSMLGQKVAKLEAEAIAASMATAAGDGGSVTSEYLTILFLGFFDESTNSALFDGCGRLERSVVIETNLIKITHNKRHALSSGLMQFSVGKAKARVNPPNDGDVPPLGVRESKRQYVTIPMDMFSTQGSPNGDTIGPQTSFVLLFRISRSVPVAGNGAVDVYCGAADGENDGEEPTCKRQKLHIQTRVFGTELILYDKYGQCQVTNADYELVMHEIAVQQPTVVGKDAGWDRTMGLTPDGDEVMEYSPEDECSNTSQDDGAMMTDVIRNALHEYEGCNIPPKLKLRVQWTKEASLGPSESSSPVAAELGGAGVGEALLGSSDKENHKPPETMSPSSTSAPFKKGLNININNNSILTPAAATAGPLDEPLGSNGQSPPVEDMPDPDHTNGLGTGETKVVVYQFTHNNCSRQRTEHTRVFRCPWCSINCGALYSLLKHLKLNHARFMFAYVAIPQGAQIDVTMNEQYDGSYNGAPQDLFFPSAAFTRRFLPARRTVVTNLLVCRPRRQKHSLSEFIECEENEYDSQRPFITGHNRMYHHTMTCLPVHPRELDIDSEAESDPLWLQHKTMQMIDEFTDVNEGEKELMKMWNLHVMKYGYVGDCQIPIALEMFIDLRGRELWARNLYRNFVLHMSSMFDFGLVSADVMQRTIRKLRKILHTNPELQRTVSEHRAEQSTYWNTVAVHRPENLKPEPRSGTGERLTSGAGASSSSSGTNGTTVGGSGTGAGAGTSGTGTNAGEGQQRKVKPTITPAKNTDPTAISPPRRRSASAAANAATAATKGAASNANAKQTPSAVTAGSAKGAAPHSTAKKTSSPSSSSSAVPSLPPPPSSFSLLCKKPTTAGGLSAFSSSTAAQQQLNKHLKSIMSPIMTRRKSLSLGIHHQQSQQRKRTSN